MLAHMPPAGMHATAAHRLMIVHLPVMSLQVVPELSAIANLDLKVAFNLDSSRVGPPQWIELAKLLDANRQHYDAFLVVHGKEL